MDIYDENKEKRITSKWLHLPIEKSKYIIKGLIDTDGSKGNELVFDTTKPDGSPRKLVNNSRLAELGWKSKTSLDEGLTKPNKWYLDNMS